MPVKREYRSIEIPVSAGGHLASDLPANKIGQADFALKENMRYEDGFLVEREGWDDFQPNINIDPATTRAMGAAVKQIGEAVRPNGERVPVGVADDKVYYWNWTTGAWTQIGSGFSASPARRWQIQNLGGYTIFNNGTDLPFTWVIGDAAVTPIYELREQGYACVGEILVANRQLKCYDVTEILPAELSGILNGGSPYGLVAANKTQRIGYREVWSNIDDPRDFAAVVAGTGTAGTPNLTLAWPMASLQNGDQITILGAGTAGGNLTTTISNIAGTAVTLGTNIVTSVTGASTQKPTAIDSIVAYSDAVMGDGSEVLRAMKLQNRVVVYKATGQIFTGYYTGDISEPWIYDSAYSVGRESRGLVFPYTLVDVSGRYHLYAGGGHFYTFSLGTNEPTEHPVLRLCEKTKFFDQLTALGVDQATLRDTVFAEINACTSEVFFFIPGQSGPTVESTGSALAYDFENERADVVTSCGFTCAASIAKPTGLKAADPKETIFIMGRSNGRVATYGRSNLNLQTMARFGNGFTRAAESGLLDFGAPAHEKAVRSYLVDCAEMSAAAENPWLLSETAVNAQHYASAAIYTAATNVFRVFSVFVKLPSSSVRPDVFIRIANSGALYRELKVQLNAGPASIVGTAGSSNGSYGIGSYGSGLYRIWVSMDKAVNEVRFGLLSGYSNSYLGGGLGCMFFGPQLELGFLPTELELSTGLVARNLIADNIGLWTPANATLTDTTLINPRSKKVSATLYGADYPSKALSTLSTFDLNDPTLPNIKYTHHLKRFLKDRIATSFGAGVRISGRTWEVGLVRDTGITRAQ